MILKNRTPREGMYGGISRGGFTRFVVVLPLEVKSHSLGRHVGGALGCCPKARSRADSRVRSAFTAPFGCIMDDWQPEVRVILLEFMKFILFFTKFIYWCLGLWGGVRLGNIHKQINKLKHLRKHLFQYYY